MSPAASLSAVIIRPTAGPTGLPARHSQTPERARGPMLRQDGSAEGASPSTLSPAVSVITRPLACCPAETQQSPTHTLQGGDKSLSFPEAVVHIGAHSLRWAFCVSTAVCTASCSHRVGIRRGIFTALKVLSAPAVPPLSWSPWSLHGLPLPECHRLGVTQQEAFSDWLFPLVACT